MDRTDLKTDTPTARPRSLSDLRSWLHSYRIRHPGRDGLPFSNRASDIIRTIDDRRPMTPEIRRAARELAELDPALAWLPAWKPRVAVPVRQ